MRYLPYANESAYPLDMSQIGNLFYSTRIPQFRVTIVRFQLKIFEFLNGPKRLNETGEIDKGTNLIWKDANHGVQQSP